MIAIKEKIPRDYFTKTYDCKEKGQLRGRDAGRDGVGRGAAVCREIGKKNPKYSLTKCKEKSK